MLVAMKQNIKINVHKALGSFIALAFILPLLCFLIYSQTRQVNIVADSSDIQWMQFVNGLGEPLTQRKKSTLNTYWNELGRKYIKIHLQDGREFNIHYFHSDTGKRRRVVIQVNVNIKTDTAEICLFYNKKLVAKGNYQLLSIIGKTVDLMKLINHQQNSSTDG